jgi:hypothetical protein
MSVLMSQPGRGGPDGPDGRVGESGVRPGQVPTITFDGFGGVPDFLIMWVPFQPYT